MLSDGSPGSGLAATEYRFASQQTGGWTPWTPIPPDFVAEVPALSGPLNVFIAGSSKRLAQRMAHWAGQTLETAEFAGSCPVGRSVCKTVIRGFKSHRRLREVPDLQGVHLRSAVSCETIGRPLRVASAAPPYLYLQVFLAQAGAVAASVRPVPGGHWRISGASRRVGGATKADHT